MEATVALAAHVYAAVSLTRDVYDYLAQLVNALASTARVPAHRVYAETVFTDMRPGRPRDLLASIRVSHAYCYVVAFSNVAKHQRALPFGVSMSMDTGVAHLGPPAFTRRGKTVVSHDALEPSTILCYCKDLWGGVDAVGQALNEERGLHNRAGS